jgi:hypothetical protein
MQDELSIHIIIAIVISVIAGIWAYYRMSSGTQIQTGHANELGDAEIIDGNAYV